MVKFVTQELQNQNQLEQEAAQQQAANDEPPAMTDAERSQAIIAAKKKL